MRDISLYVKTIDGCSWYVGDQPADPSRGPCHALGRYIYRASIWSAEENRQRAEGYARAVVSMYQDHASLRYTIAD